MTASLHEAAPTEQTRALPSGRSVILRTGTGQEEIEIRAPDGAVEVRITLSASGPVVQLRSARLEIQTVEDVNVQCRRFAVQASDALELHSDGDTRITAAGGLVVRTDKDTRINSEKIYLNCD